MSSRRPGRPSKRSDAPAKRTGTRRQGRQLYGPRRRIPWIPIVGAVVLVGVGYLLFRQLEIGAPGERVLVSGVGQHVPEGQAVAYNSVPPVGGPHWPTPAAWGATDQPVPDERAVHNLEHGGVVVSYNAISADDLNRLKGLLQSYPRDKWSEVKLLIRPYSQIPAGTFVLAAWGWKEAFSAYDDARVRLFLDAHIDKCCEDVP